MPPRTGNELEIDELRITYSGVTVDGPRADMISRRTVELLQQIVEADPEWATRTDAIETLVVPPIKLPIAGSSDETIARTTAETIFRALVNTP